MKNLIKKFGQSVYAKIVLCVFVAFLAFGGIFYFEKAMNNRVNIENSLVSAPIIPVTSTTNGKLRSINVVEGQQVKKGDLIGVVGSEQVRAYDDGMVIETSKTIGAMASPATPIAKLINANEMRITGTIDENKGLSNMKVGQVASFTIDALAGKTFWGYVDEIAPSAKQTSMTFSISSERPTQQFEVFVRFDAKKYPEIKNGMSAKMIVFTATL